MADPVGGAGRCNSMHHGNPTGSQAFSCKGWVCITFVSQRPIIVSKTDELSYLFSMVSSLGLEPRTLAGSRPRA